MPNNYKSLLIAFLATITRYYNYSIFGLSASILSEYLMPHGEGAYKMSFFFLIFSLAAITRPIGAMIFGPIGDKIGRVYSIKIAAIFSALSTMCIAFIPNFTFLGISSVILLTLSRMFFLLSFAGEVDAIKIFVSEVAKNYRYIANSLVIFFSQIGVILASICYHFTALHDNFHWLWRINFAIGGVMGIIVIGMRNSLVESEDFLIAKAEAPDDQNSLFTLVAKYRLKFFLATLISGFIGSVYHFLIIFLSSFLYYTAQIITSQKASVNNIILIILYLVSTPIAGYVSEKYKNLMQPLIALIFSFILLIIMIYIGADYYLLIHKLLIILVPFYSVPCGVIILSLFPTIDKMRMCSLSHSIGSLLLSSTTPMFCMLIWQYNHSVESILLYFLISLLSLTLVLLYINWQKLLRLK
ncbi:MAG: MFS transporter [Rickettsiaceae bacterium]|nr:MFS transporter [Rickettsiaceae bacterium]